MILWCLSGKRWHDIDENINQEKEKEENKKKKEEKKWNRQVMV